MIFFKYSFYKRLFDIIFSFISLIIFSVPILIITILIKIISGGPVFYVTERSGKFDVKFRMFKFRTMQIQTPELSSEHLLQPEKYITRFGSFLRKTGLDELPQLINIFKGDMSFVGPRPLIYDDYELILLRKKSGVNSLIPGLTGLAQIKGRCRLTAKEKFYFDHIYLDKISFNTDLLIIFRTNIFLLNETFTPLKYIVSIEHILALMRNLQGNIIKHASILLLYIFYITGNEGKFQDYTYFVICKSYEFCLNL